MGRVFVGVTLLALLGWAAPHWRWRNIAAGVALGALILASAAVGVLLYLRFSAPDCGLCDAATSSVSRAPGP
jgi:hypothetical protein